MGKIRKDINMDGGSLREYLVELFSFYKSVGLFSQYSAEDTEEFLERVKSYIQEEFGFKLEQLYEKVKLRKLMDLLIMTFDRQKVWLGETREEITLEGRLYEKTLHQWSNISGGRFLPASIREIWDEEEELIYVDIVEKDIFKRVKLELLPDILDVGSLTKQVNELFGGSESRFQIIGLDEIALVVMLTEEERSKLQSERGFEFVQEEELEGFPPAKLAVYLKSFRKAFNKWRIFEFVLFLIAAFDFAYISYKGFTLVSDNFVGRLAGHGYYLPADRYYWIFIGIFIGVILGGYASRGLLRTILKDKNEGYSVYLNMFCGEGQLSRRIFKYISVLIGCLSAAAVFLGLNWYVVFSEDEIRINPLWSLKEVRYEYGDVESLKKVETSETEMEGKADKNYIVISFNDGTFWTSNSEGRTPSSQLDEEIIKFVSRESGKAVEVSK